MMRLISFQHLPLVMNVAIFAAAAAVIWLAGFRLSIYADAIAERKQLGRAFVGTLLLGVATSLPEIATSITAASLGNATLAASNLMGGVATQVAVLAVVDWFFVRGALTFFSPKPVLLLSGVLLMMQISLALAAMAAGEFFSLLGIGLWPAILLGTYVMFVFSLYRYEGRDRWAAVDIPDAAYEEQVSQIDQSRYQDFAFAQLVFRFLFYAGLIVIAGWAVSTSADALAEQTGLGSGFVGATILAIATSLPEISTTLGAVRVGAYTMAIANIFGTNTLEVGLLFVADIAYRDGLMIEQVDRAAQFVAALGALVTGIYLWGLLERQNNTILGMGVDSALVLVAWLIGMIGLHFLT
ncbi:sodium:calcium antiporter [Thalassoroseus pseudoceratinae]|uniref:sodium:calcium antiporter n=1 Tax=Thalassoroseus pseudoceratinae TaxID=2713176 RepID=UPI00197DEBA0|nr:sodium:calcium antiporter [Thalassoroseus pseudoceratinae]